MAAFCTCCGEPITPKSEICMACGAPSHGMNLKASKFSRATDERVVLEAKPTLEAPLNKRIISNCCAA